MECGTHSYRRFLDWDANGIIEIIRDYKDGLILFLNRYVNNIHDVTFETGTYTLVYFPKYMLWIPWAEPSK